MGKRHLLGVEDVIHAGGRATLDGTMENNQGLMWHAWMHEGMYPAHTYFGQHANLMQCWGTMQFSLPLVSDNLKSFRMDHSGIMLVIVCKTVLVV